MKRSVSIIISAVFLAAGYCHADDKPSSPQKLDPIIVTASRVPERPSGSIFGTTVLQSSKSVDVITAEDIDDSGAKNVPEALRGHAGINVSEYIGNGKTAQVDVRGFGETAPSNVLVLIDGRRTNQIDISGADWLQIDVNSIEKIEIVRGSGSVLYGDNAVGGVINIVTKKGKGMKPELGVMYETGSYHYNTYSANALGGSAFLDYAVNLRNMTSDGFRGNSDIETDDITGTMTVRPTETFNVRFAGGYHKDWFGMPGSVTDVQIDRDGWRACDSPGDRGKTEDGYGVVGLDFFGRGGSEGTAVTVDFIARSRRSATLSFFTPWYENNSHIKTFGVTPKAVMEFVMAGFLNRLVIGADYYKYRDEILGTNWVNVLFGDGRQKDLINIDEETFGFYVTETAEITPKFTVNGGFRGEYAGYSFDQEYITASTNTKRSFEPAFDAGLNYMYNERSAVYASVARSFRFPAVDEWYQSTMSIAGVIIAGGMNLDLEPQTGMNYEIGVRDNTIKWLKASADCYIMDTKHELYMDPVAGVNMVYDKTMRRGLELDTHILPADGLDIYARYTYEKAFFIGSHYAGNEVPMVPTQMLTWGVNYTFMDCVDFTYRFNFVGPRRLISDQRNIGRQLKQYITNDIRLGYRKHGFEVYGALNNILDFKYSEIGTWGTYFPANGRNFLFGVKQKF